ncbi:TetR/AcrR family transcriptional regulator [Streptomyces sp. NPDC059063]|uniref:TetR/AcrR family transcriptional regulator n=1 Tax=unclassified Streptomyces TaxID=2593676 RepID=UPI00369E82B9
MTSPTKKPEKTEKTGKPQKPEPPEKPAGGASRRARHRAQTTAEIKATALKHLVEGGTDAVALRAIARDMGMAPGTFYTYFDTREALLAALAADTYRALAAHLRAARDTARDPAERALAHGLAYREWALAHPQEFRLLFSDRGGAPRADTADSTEAEYELCLGIVEIATTARLAAPGSAYTWTDFDPSFTEVARAAFPSLTPTALALSLRLWGRMHGLVTLEIDGLLRPQITTPDRLFRDELVDVVRWLGF